MAARASSCRDSRRRLVETLEPRELLSVSSTPDPFKFSNSLGARAADTVPLGGTYSGTVHLNGGRAALAGGPALRAISVTFSSTGNVGPLSGTVSVDGVGNLPFVGGADGTHLTLLLSGTAGISGELTGSLTQHGELFSGQFAENSAGRSLTGSFHVHSGGNAVAVGASNIPLAPGNRVSHPTLGATYTGSSMRGATVSKAALVINSQASDGQVSGLLAIGSQSFDLSGTIVGSRLDFLLSGSAVGDGSLTISSGAHTLQGTFAEQNTSGIARSQLTVSDATTTTTTLSGMPTTAAHNPGSTVGLNTGVSGIGGFTGGLTSPISGIGAPISGTGAAGTMPGMPINGGVSTPVTGTTGPITGNPTGPITGNPTAPVTGNPTGPITGATTPPITGATTPPVTGNISPPPTGNVFNPMI